MRIAFGSPFDVPDGYLDTASIGVPPTPVADAVAAAVQDWRRAAARPADFGPAVAVARAAFGRLVGFPADRVAVGSTVSGLLGMVAASLPAGSRVLVARGDFTSVSWPFAAAPGVTVDEAELHDVPARAGEYDAVAVSVVQSADGRIVDLDGLRAARTNGTRVVLDTTQATGWLDADLGWADVVVCGGYKWLLSPRGVAWMAVRADLPLVAHQAGWFAGDDPWASAYGLPLRLAPDARAYDTSPAWYCHVGAALALPWLAGLDRAAVHTHCAGLADAFRAELGMEPAGSAIVAVSRPGAAERLAAAGVVASVRAGAARLAFHLYNTEADVERAVAALT